MTTPFEVLDLSIDQLTVSPINVRQNIGDVSELADSIREQGVLEPLVARRVASGSYEVIIGARRLTAARQVGLSSIPVIVQDISDVNATIRSLVENIQRGDLSLEERVEAYRRLADMEPQRFSDTRSLARATGCSNIRIVRDYEAYEAIQVLRPRKIEVKRNVPPSDPERREGRAIPEAHATLLEQAVTAVRSKLPEDRTEDIYEELAKAIAPLPVDRARRLLDYFKMFPDFEVAEIAARAFATVHRDVTVPAETARRLEEFAAERGQRDWGEAIAELIELAAPPEVADAGRSEQENVNTAVIDIAPPTMETAQKEVELPSIQSPEQSPKGLTLPPHQPIRLPEEPLAEQLKNKTIWNIQHFGVNADFYTVGYAGRNIGQFLEILKTAGVNTVIDVRQNQSSQHKPSFSGSNLAEAVSEYDIKYVHRDDLGVPGDVRQRAADDSSRSEIWTWYEANILGQRQGGKLKELIDEYEQPVAFLCFEPDPTACHRHLLSKALKNEGLRGFDL